MTNFERTSVVAVLLLAAGCSSGSGTSSGTGGTTAFGGSGGTVGSGGNGGSAAASSGGGGGGNAGSGGTAGPTADLKNCKTAADCPGGTCQILNATVAGYTKGSPIGACVYPIVEATECLGSPLDECCKTADCTGGKCVLFPPNPECPDPDPPTPHNVCTAGSCTGCAPNGTEFCIPAGAWGYKQSQCLKGWCFQNDSCESLEPGSKCLPVFDACGKASAIACVPPVIGCQKPSDCPSGKSCKVTQGVAICS